MLADASNYIGNPSFLNMLSSIDVNDIDPKNKGRVSSIYFVCSQMRAFHDLSRFQGEVREWLHRY